MTSRRTPGSSASDANSRNPNCAKWRRFTAAVLPGNADMQLVFQTVGLSTHTTFDDGVVNVTLDLTTLAAMRDETRIRSPQPTVASDRRGTALAS